MGIRERQSRNLPSQKAWCSHWQMPIDPLEKACYKWEKQIHFHSTLHSPEKSNHKTIYKHKKKQPKMRTAMTLNGATTQKPLKRNLQLKQKQKEPVNSIKQKPQREKPEQKSLEMEVKNQKG
jgi:hypothetical protein